MEATKIGQNPFAPQAQNAAPQAPAAPPMSPFGNPDGDVFEFDLTNAQSSAAIPVGQYLVRLSDLTKETSRKSGNEMWVFSMEILAKSDGTPTPSAGRIGKKFCALTPAALGILADTLAAFGLGGAGSNAKFSKADALNRLCYVEVVAGEYNDQPTTNINKMWPYQNIGQKYNAGGTFIPGQ